MASIVPSWHLDASFRKLPALSPSLSARTITPTLFKSSNYMKWKPKPQKNLLLVKMKEKKLLKMQSLPKVLRSQAKIAPASIWTIPILSLSRFFQQGSISDCSRSQQKLNQPKKSARLEISFQEISFPLKYGSHSGGILSLKLPCMTPMYSRFDTLVYGCLLLVSFHITVINTTHHTRIPAKNRINGCSWLQNGEDTGTSKPQAQWRIHGRLAYRNRQGDAQGTSLRLRGGGIAGFQRWGLDPSRHGHYVLFHT
jgi:hypothetical protein